MEVKMRKMDYLVFHCFLLLITLGFQPSFGWKLLTHVALGNECLDQLSATMPATAVQAKMTAGSVEIDVGDVAWYRCIIANQEVFRAGCLGPDAFPDLESGQKYMHPNNGKLGGIGASVKLENRHCPAKSFRGIDYAMVLLDKARNYGNSATIAFALGYLCHVVGDGFGHTWVNEKSHGAWNLTNGSGSFGPLTEEVRHTAVEMLVDLNLPNRLLNTSNNTNDDRINSSAPYQFLDEFYNSKIDGCFIGGAIYDYFQYQIDALKAIDSIAQVNLIDLHKLLIEPNSNFKIGGWCFLFRKKADSFLEQYKTSYSTFASNPYLGMHNDLAILIQKVNALRRNWMVMSLATVENIAKSNSPSSTDKCLSVNNDDHLWYGDLQDSAEKAVFRNRLIGMFAMNPPDYHKTANNILRQLKYLEESFILDEIADKFIPNRIDNLLNHANFLNNSGYVSTIGGKENLKKLTEKLSTTKIAISAKTADKVCSVMELVGGDSFKRLLQVFAIAKTLETMSSKGPYGYINFAFLDQDLKDQYWFNKLLPSDSDPNYADVKKFLEDIRDGKKIFSGSAQRTLANCSYSVNGAFDQDSSFGLLFHCENMFTQPGPTASVIIAEIGSDFTNSLNPAYNTIQACKLAPLKNTADIERLFTVSGGSTSLLPWKSGANLYSSIAVSMPNVFVDAVASLDDPNCYNCDEPGFEYQTMPNPADTTKTLKWARSRGIAVWNTSGAATPYVNTCFMLATTNDAVENVYKKIFKFPR
jgi:hypothetical protein